MQRLRFCLIPLLVFGLGSLVYADQKFGAEHTGKIPFIVGFEKAKAEAAWSGRPMMVFFTTTW